MPYLFGHVDEHSIITAGMQYDYNNYLLFITRHTKNYKYLNEISSNNIEWHIMGYTQYYVTSF